MKKNIFILFFAFFTFALHARVDQFNTYRWNRDNVISGNGQIDERPWYEWWYYKIVLPETSESFFFVYGAINPWDHAYTLKGTRSHVGMGDFNSMTQTEEHYPIANFSSRYDTTYVLVKENVASDKFAKGQIKDAEGNVIWWDFTIAHEWTFNAAGWATGRMFTNIEWYPAQASAKCSGEVFSSNKLYKFKNAPCYQDRNWGNSFPEWWTWIVSNHFEKNPETALAIGGGKPKFFGRYNLMEGVAIGLKHKGIEYTWRPNDMDKVKIDINFGKWEVTGVNKKYKIEVSAHAPKEKFMDLQFMTPEGQIFHDYQALTGYSIVKLYKKIGVLGSKWELIETLISNHTGIEYGSDDQNPDKNFLMLHKNLYSNF